MGDYLKNVLASGRQILGDTKAPPKPKSQKAQPTPLTQLGGGETDPHKLFVKKTVFDKPKKTDLVKDFERFISQAEDSL